MYNPGSTVCLCPVLCPVEVVAVRLWIAWLCVQNNLLLLYSLSENFHQKRTLMRTTTDTFIRLGDSHRSWTLSLLMVLSMCFCLTDFVLWNFVAHWDVVTWLKRTENGPVFQIAFLVLVPKIFQTENIQNEDMTLHLKNLVSSLSCLKLVRPIHLGFSKSKFDECYSTQNWADPGRGF